MDYHGPDKKMPAGNRSARRITVKPYFAAAIALLLMFSAPSVLAQRKTDVVKLYNGDRITGEIKSLSNGVLKYSTDSLGTVNIEWQDVASLESKYYYEVRTSNGLRHYGSIAQSQVPGRLTLVELEGNRELEWLQVVDLRPIEADFIDRLDVYAAAGYSYTRASAVSQTTLNTNIDYEDEKSRIALDGRATFTETRDDNTKSSKFDLNRMVWTSRAGVFRAGFGSYETNDELALDHRVGVGGGFGRFLLDSYRNRLTGLVGLQVITEQSSVTGSDQNLELVLGSDYQAWHLNTPELDLKFGLNIYPSITDAGRLRSSSDFRIRWELIEDLFLDVTAYGTYDNRADTDNDYDYGVTTGLGWEL